MGLFSEWLGSEMRQRKVWSVNRLAHEAGIDPLRVSDWMLDRSLPSATEAIQLATYLGLPAGEVCQRAGVRRHPGSSPTTPLPGPGRRHALVW